MCHVFTARDELPEVGMMPDVAHLPCRAQQTSEWSLESRYHGKETFSSSLLIPIEKLPHVLTDPPVTC